MSRVKLFYLSIALMSFFVMKSMAYPSAVTAQWPQVRHY
jgi:hypothetical protein